ncbi:MAG: type II toxin-antitoxin system PemK/MazF family toxin [Solirubrobacteraceae bacterium]
MVARGEVRWLELEEEGRRPVLVLTRDEAIDRLRNVVVALITRTIRGIESEVELGPADGMPVECAVSLDNLRTVPRALLAESITKLAPAQMDEIYRALVRSTGCRRAGAGRPSVRWTRWLDLHHSQKEHLAARGARPAWRGKCAGRGTALVLRSLRWRGSSAGMTPRWIR